MANAGAAPAPVSFFDTQEQVCGCGVLLVGCFVGWGAIVENVAEAMATIDRHLYLHNGFWKFHFHCNCGHDGRSGCVCFVMLCCCCYFCCLHTHLPLRLPFKCSIVYNCQILSWIQFLLLLLVPSVYIFVCVCVFVTPFLDL